MQVMRVLALLLPMLSALAVRAEEVEVDVELVLAVDVSRSMTANELEIQRRGYAEALVSEDVLMAIRTGIVGQVAVTYVEWAGAGSQRVVVPWTLIRDRADAEAFAAKLTASFVEALRRTSISGGIDYAASLFDDNGFEGMRQVIDVSGDGPNNQGRPVTAARDDALARGIVINGLPLMTREGMGWQSTLEDLDEYYRNCVVGGPAAFVIPVLDWAEFAGAVRRKLVLELAGLVPEAEPRVIPAAGYDCLVGEKMWERMRQYWSEP